MSDFDILVKDLNDIGISRGDSVLLHSSYKSMGGLDGGIQTLVDAMLSVIGEEGTLIVPTLSYATVTENEPVFNYLDTPSCVGAIPEYVRKLSGAVRSIHPTHSCAAIGAKKEYYTVGHENDRTPVGKNSPFFKLRLDKGKTLLLGCSPHRNTGMHGVEEYLGVPYVLTAPPITHEIILPDRKYKAEYKRHSIRQNGFEQRYGRLADIMTDKISRGLIHGAQSILMDTAAMWETAIEALAADPYFFVERSDSFQK